MQFQITFTSMHYGYEKQKETAMFGCLKIYLISLKYRITYIQNQFKSYFQKNYLTCIAFFLNRDSLSILNWAEFLVIFWTEQNFIANLPLNFFIS